MAGFWSKLPLLRTLLLSHPEVEFFWWMDSDAFFTDMAFEPPWDRAKHRQLFPAQLPVVARPSRCLGPHGSQWTRQRGGWQEARRILKGRPVFEADDQSALVYLLVTQHGTWSDKVYLENSYYLHGFWEILVDRYEEMVEKNHPGLGDDRWPLVTHFVGCKPCKTFSSYPIKRCLKQMDRAFYFADNQVLQMYGFAYKSLNTSSLRRVREQSVGPADANNEVSRVLYPSLMNGN
ncbi:Galactosyl transferase GMA12/MNN10 family protein [Rhynchospora pubera]|uniref:Galactosyl transferase GMA12/MNN10 family protein n=1 Tax=Rhynchospora pubera TaxID=906938 RepID=A0AAV8HMV9_9POAL|nr:Galactosyl transferase GMA12/MNN10 family protein [Rhynchospora pubera]